MAIATTFSPEPIMIYASSLPFRQVHLDFHTSGHIPGVGARFNNAQFQEMLRRGHVNSVTLFSKCHHGYSYHDTRVGERHPHLHCDLLPLQMEASHEIGVQTPTTSRRAWTK
jgi:hypothetical protein